MNNKPSLRLFFIRMSGTRNHNSLNNNYSMKISATTAAIGLTTLCVQELKTIYKDHVNKT